MIDPAKTAENMFAGFRPLPPKRAKIAVYTAELSRRHIGIDPRTGSLDAEPSTGDFIHDPALGKVSIPENAVLTQGKKKGSVAFRVQTEFAGPAVAEIRRPSMVQEMLSFLPGKHLMQTAVVTPDTQLRVSSQLPD